MEEFVPVATFSLSKDIRVERLLPAFLSELDSPFEPRGLDRLLHGPPGFDHASSIPPYLLLSILRV